MGKITDRRERTAHTVIENKAVLADAPKSKGEFPYKKLIIAVFVVIALAACVLLVLNAFVDTYAAKFNEGESHIDASATVEPAGDLYEQLTELMTNEKFRDVYLAASANHATSYATINSSASIYNYVVDITTPNDADTADVATVMVLSLNTATNKISYFAINKMVLVTIPTVGVGPIYDAYAFGGGALLARTIQENFGIEISGYVDMPLEAFAQATVNVGGIKINDQTLTEDEQKLDTAAKLYNYVDQAEDRNAAMTEVIKALAAKSAEAGIFGLKETVDIVADSITASVAREDFGAMIKMLVGMFKNDASVYQIGYETAKQVTKTSKPWSSYEEFRTIDYSYEISKMVSVIYPSAK